MYQHVSVESLRRELQRNSELRELCGFNLFHGIEAVPTSSAYSRFLKNLFKVSDIVEEIFKVLVKEINILLPDFGKVIAFDGKAIETYANGKKKEKGNESDGRRDADADWGKKVYRGKREDGTLWEKVKSWFGYKIHLIVDAKYELPIAFEVTKASKSEVSQMHELFNKVEENHKEILDGCEYGAGDRGYDDVKLIRKFWEDYKIKPVIDIRNMWKDGEETKVINGKWNVVYNYKGDVYCICPETGKQREMAYGGFEKDRETLKYCCPAKHYGSACSGNCKCPVKKSVRISLKENDRIFR